MTIGGLATLTHCWLHRLWRTPWRPHRCWFLEIPFFSSAVASVTPLVRPSGSIPHQPGRPLMFDDFSSADIPLWIPPPPPPLMLAPPRRLFPCSPVDIHMGCLPPIGLWLQPEARCRTGKVCATLLAPVLQQSPLLGLQLLLTTGVLCHYSRCTSSLPVPRATRHSPRRIQDTLWLDPPTSPRF